MTTTQTTSGLSADNPTSVQSLEQLNSATQSTTQTFVQQPGESTKNTPLTTAEINAALNAAGVNSNGSVNSQELPFVTVKTTQKLVTAVSGSGVPSAKPVVLDNKNINLQPGLGLDAVADVIIPFARAAMIRFEASKLKPNTKYHAFFNEYNVTEFCYTGNSTANISGFSTTTMTSKLESQKLANVAGHESANVILSEWGNIYSDYKGYVSGAFMFNPEVGLKVPSGDILFRLTDSSTNGEDKESFADAIYTSVGRLIKTTPVPKPSPKPDYGKGGKVPSKPSPGNGNSSPPKTEEYGWLEHHIAFLNNIPLSAITNEMKEKAYKEYSRTHGGAVMQSDILMKAIVPGAKDYNISGTVGAANYNFVSGNNASNKNAKLSDGTKIGDNLTAVNILSATNKTTGKTFVEDVEKQIKTVGGDPAWKLAVGSYEGTKKLVEQAVKNDKLTPDMQKFWDTGVKTGAFNPKNPADIQKAINNYAAATTLGMFSQTTAKSQTTSNATKTNGFAPSLKAPAATKKNSTSTSTGKK